MPALQSVSWAYLDLVNISLFLVSGCLQAYNIIAYEIAIPGQIEDDAMLARIKALGRTQYLEEKMQVTHASIQAFAFVNESQCQ